MIYLIIVLASFLIGFNISVISGTLVFLQNNLLTTPFQQELVVGSVLVGSLIGLVGVAALIDWCGRRNVLVISYALFFAGAILFALSESLDGLVVGRLLSGMAMGASSVVAPMFLSEISQKDKRGSIVSLHQFAITTGILMGYFSNYMVDATDAWRTPYALSSLVAALGLFGAVLSRRFQLTHEPVREKKHFFQIPKGLGWPLFLGIMLAVLQQVTGINAVIYYAPNLLLNEGVQSQEVALFTSLGIGVVNWVMTIFAIYFIDKIGRKPLLIFGSIGMILGLALSIVGWIQIGILIYVAAFAASLGPVTWVYLAEIYPERCRGKMISIATFSNLFFNGVIAFTVLHLLLWIGVTGLFTIFIGFSLLTIVFTIYCLPETKGRSLHEIEESFK